MVFSAVDCLVTFNPLNETDLPVAVGASFIGCSV